MRPLDPYRPRPERPWDRDAASHLLRRTGFAGTPAEIQGTLDLGPEQALDRVLAGPGPEPGIEAEVEDLIALAPGEMRASFDEVDWMRRGWFHRMVRTAHPLAETLVLFWHDHFATREGGAIRGELLGLQHRLFREHGLGSFRELLDGIAHDPATLTFLDARLNRHENPNENFARELLELFTLGIDQYSQGDVVEIARVFTGWGTEKDGGAAFHFDSKAHDRGDKRVFGEDIQGRAGDRGQLEGLQVLDGILAHPAHGRFLATKWIEWFLGPAPEGVDDGPLIDQVGQVYVESDLRIDVALRALLGSEAFFDPARRWNRYRSPTELVVAALRLLGVQNPDRAFPANWARRLGMELFRPPSVGGWNHGRAWVSSQTLALRMHLATYLADLPHTSRRVEGSAAFDLDALGAGRDAQPNDLVEHLAARIVQRPLQPEAISAISRALFEQEPRGRDRASGHARVRSALQYLLATPEFALA